MNSAPRLWGVFRSGMHYASVRLVPKLFPGVFFLLILPVRLCAFVNGDRQVWWQGTLEKSLAPSWALYLGHELRYGNDLRHLNLGRIDGGLMYRFSRVAECAVGYKQVCRESGASTWQTVYIPTMDWWFYWRGRVLSVTWQSKFEYQFPAGEANTPVDRNKITLARVRTWSTLPVQPFVAAELFYYFRDRQVQIRRLFIGFHYAPPQAFIRATLQYLANQTATASGWLTCHTLVVGLKCSF